MAAYSSRQQAPRSGEREQRLAPLDVILVRHAEAVPPGTPGYADDDRPLTPAGVVAARELAAQLEPWHVDAVYSSPYLRAVATVTPAADARGLEVQLIDDLRERRLSPDPLEDWRVHLERAWQDADYVLEGGESGRTAQRRGVAVLDLLRSRHPDGGRLLVGSHGNLIGLILQALEPGVSFHFHMEMPMPALYRISHDGIGWRVMGGHGFAQRGEVTEAS